MKNPVFKAKVTIIPSSRIPAFAAYAAKSFLDGVPLVALNVEAFLQSTHAGDIKSSDVAYVMAERIAHEVIHIVQEWAGLKFSEKKVEAIIARVQKKHLRLCRK